MQPYSSRLEVSKQKTTLENGPKGKNDNGGDYKYRVKSEKYFGVYNKFR